MKISKSIVKKKDEQCVMRGCICMQLVSNNECKKMNSVCVCVYIIEENKENDDSFGVFAYKMIVMKMMMMMN